MWADLQDVEIVEDGPKHTLVLYNCRVPQTGEVGFTAANAKCSANLKVKGEPLLPRYRLGPSLDLEDCWSLPKGRDQQEEAPGVFV